MAETPLEELRRLSEELGIALTAVQPFTEGGHPVVYETIDQAWRAMADAKSFVDGLTDPATLERGVAAIRKTWAINADEARGILTAALNAMVGKP